MLLDAAKELVQRRARLAEGGAEFTGQAGTVADRPLFAPCKFEPPGQLREPHRTDRGAGGLDLVRNRRDRGRVVGLQRKVDFAEQLLGLALEQRDGALTDFSDLVD